MKRWTLGSLNVAIRKIFPRLQNLWVWFTEISKFVKSLECDSQMCFNRRSQCGRLGYDRLKIDTFAPSFNPHSVNHTQQIWQIWKYPCSVNLTLHHFKAAWHFSLEFTLCWMLKVMWLVLINLSALLLWNLFRSLLL